MPYHDSMPSSYPVFPDSLPDAVLRDKRYEVRFARNADALDAIQKLRFDVFNLELGEGLDKSYENQRDQDRFDPLCHHLLVLERHSGELIGTYRMQTCDMAEHYDGFYSADEFDLEGLPREVVRDSVEIGRACVAQSYRNRAVLFLLWKGLAAYMTRNRKRYLFGCCSLTSQDPAEGKRVMEHLEHEGHVHAAWRVSPRPGWVCYEGDFSLTRQQRDAPVDLPKLFKLYLRYGAKVCGEPALDTFFKTIDYLVLLDLHELDQHSRAMFFGVQ